MTDPTTPAQPTGGEEYAAAVLDVVRCIPSGRAMTYGLIAEIVGEQLGRGGPRQVGNVMAGSESRYAHLVPDDGADDPAVGPDDDVDGDGEPSSAQGVPWWRVVNAAGSPPKQHLTEALDALRAEGCPLSRDGRRVNLRRAIWFPDDERAQDAAD